MCGERGEIERESEGRRGETAGETEGRGERRVGRDIKKLPK